VQIKIVWTGSSQLLIGDAENKLPDPEAGGSVAVEHREDDRRACSDI
jgi:hypothetical protein